MPGGTPVFQIGTVVAGVTPSVTLSKVNPLLYTLNFVIPSAGLNTNNLWTGIQTFQQQAVFQAGLQAAGDSSIDNLVVSTTFVSQGTSQFVGLSTFSGAASFLAGITVVGGVDTDNLTVSGDAIFSGATPLSAGECLKGQVYLDSCGKLRYITGGFPNVASNAGSFSTTITPGSTETALSVNVPFTIPSSCTCGSAMSRDITVRGLLEFTPSAEVAITQSGSPPYAVTAAAVRVSTYIMQIRLDNATTGALIYSSRVSNLDTARNFITLASGIGPGAHTAFVTLQGQGIGTQNLLAVGLSMSVEF